MDDLSSPTSVTKSKTKSIIWRPLLPNIRCTQVPLTEVASVLDLYMFDTMSLGGSKLGEGYEILPERITNLYIFPRKMDASVLSGSTYFETCLKHWQEPYLCICGSEFKTTNSEAPKNIPVNAYEIEKVTLVETGETT